MDKSAFKAIIGVLIFLLICFILISGGLYSKKTKCEDELAKKSLICDKDLAKLVLT